MIEHLVGELHQAMDRGVIGVRVLAAASQATVATTAGVSPGRV
jgi:hypothetical protein